KRSPCCLVDSTMVLTHSCGRASNCSMNAFVAECSGSTCTVSMCSPCLPDCPAAGKLPVRQHHFMRCTKPQEGPMQQGAAGAQRSGRAAEHQTACPVRRQAGVIGMFGLVVERVAQDGIQAFDFAVVARLRPFD